MKPLKLPDALKYLNNDGMASIGMVMILFSMALLVLYPLILGIMAGTVIETVKQEVTLASEIAAVDLLTDLSTEALGERRFEFDVDLKSAYRTLLIERLKEVSVPVKPDNLVVNWHVEREGGVIEVAYTFLYGGILQFEAKEMNVSFSVQVPIDD
ncbi:hypothetical protein [Fusibacter tunisiensis]|nr:hypothetical protein [Fusibacter tunisiensis]